MKNLTIIGATDSVNECDCCGKTGLKFTYVMTNEDGIELYYGGTCGAKASGSSLVQIKETVKAINFNNKIDEMVKEATNQHLQDKLIKYLTKKGADMEAFFLKYGEMIDDMGLCAGYLFGSKVKIINK